MASEKIKAFLAGLGTDPRAKELMRRTAQADSEEEMIKACIEIGKGFGIDLTPEELRDYLRETAEAQRKRTEDRAEAIRLLEDSELDSVAGGKDHSNCKDTFKHEENCWFNDGCDVSFNKYKGEYLCHDYYLGHEDCSALDQAGCMQFLL